MHDFFELVDRCTAFTLNALDQAQQKAIDGLSEDAATTQVKALQSVTLQRAIIAVGMFSMFDAILQDRLGCKDGFKEAGRLLAKLGHLTLAERFADMQLAVNLLKHGEGRSYDALLKKAGSLPFVVMPEEEHFFCEGDVGEVATLVFADNNFVMMCADLIREVTFALRHGGCRI